MKKKIFGVAFSVALLFGLVSTIISADAMPPKGVYVSTDCWSVVGDYWLGGSNDCDYSELGNCGDNDCSRFEGAYEL